MEQARKIPARATGNVVTSERKVIVHHISVPPVSEHQADHDTTFEIYVNGVLAKTVHHYQTRRFGLVASERDTPSAPYA